MRTGLPRHVTAALLEQWCWGGWDSAGGGRGVSRRQAQCLPRPLRRAALRKCKRADIPGGSAWRRPLSVSSRQAALQDAVRGVLRAPNSQRVSGGARAHLPCDQNRPGERIGVVAPSAGPAHPSSVHLLPRDVRREAEALTIARRYAGPDHQLRRSPLGGTL